jgi:hypothetical protein
MTVVTVETNIVYLVSTATKIFCEARQHEGRAVGRMRSVANLKTDGY